MFVSRQTTDASCQKISDLSRRQAIGAVGTLTVALLASPFQAGYALRDENMHFVMIDGWVLRRDDLTEADDQ
jgi:hypothetical protein